MALRSAACCWFVVLVAGCGGGGGETRTVTVEATRDDAETPTADQDQSAPSNDSIDDANTRLLIASIREGYAKYCVKVLGARIGRTDPPSRKDLELVGNGTRTIQKYLKPANWELEVEPGVTVRDAVFDMAKMLRNGDCDPERARKIETAAIDAG